MRHYTVKMVLGKGVVQHSFDVLVDSDALVGWFWAADIHHSKATEIFHNLEIANRQLVLTSFVVAETATVLSHRSGQPIARIFLEHIERSHIPVIHITEPLQTAALQLFKAQTKKGTSLTDCANVVVARQFAIPRMFSFDEVYPKKFDLELLNNGL
jgi:predicted nucleic acid-binding protein